MGTAWIDSVKKTKQLTIFAGRSVGTGHWSAVYDQMLATFNKLSNELKLGVTVAPSDQRPGASDASGANILFELVNGKYAFDVDGQKLSGSLAGARLHGETLQVSRAFSQKLGKGTVETTRMEKALILVPSKPMASFQHRPAGDGVKLVIAVHELIHACGLDSSDHTTDDVFVDVSSLEAGDTPAQDRVRAGSRVLPPIVMSAQTARKITALWS